MAKIVDIEPKYGHRMLIEFDNGSTLLLNMQDKLDTVRFHDLQNEHIFADCVTDGYSLYWDFGRISLGITEIYEMTGRRQIEKNDDTRVG